MPPRSSSGSAPRSARRGGQNDPPSQAPNCGHRNEEEEPPPPPPEPEGASSNARAGLCFPAPLDPLGGIACTKAAASEEGAESEAHPLLVINQVVCAAAAPGPETDEQQGEPIGDTTDQGSAFLLVSACRASATPGGVAIGEADAAILEIESEQGSLTVGRSHSEARRNNAVGESEAEFTLLEAQSGENNLTVLDCQSVSRQNPGEGESNTENETSGTLISSGDQSAEDPGLCALFVESHATGGETP